MTTESFGGRPPRYPDSPDAGRTVPSDPDSPDVGRRPPRYPDSPDDGRTVPSDPPDSPDAGRKVYPDSPDAGRKLPIDPDSPDAGRMVPTESFGMRSPRTDLDSPRGGRTQSTYHPSPPYLPSPQSSSPRSCRPFWPNHHCPLSRHCSVSNGMKLPSSTMAASRRPTTGTS